MDPAALLTLLGWTLFTACPVAAAAVSVVAWRTGSRVLALVTVLVSGVTLVIAAVLPMAAPPLVIAVTTAAGVVTAVAGGSPVTRLLLARTSFEAVGEHGGVVVGEREVLRGGEVVGLLERAAVAGAVIAGMPEALAIVIAIKGLGRFNDLETSAVRERFIVGTLASWIWAAAAAGTVVLTRS